MDTRLVSIPTLISQYLKHTKRTADKTDPDETLTILIDTTPLKIALPPFSSIGVIDADDNPIPDSTPTEEEYTSLVYTALRDVPDGTGIKIFNMNTPTVSLILNRASKVPLMSEPETGVVVFSTGHAYTADMVELLGARFGEKVVAKVHERIEASMVQISKLVEYWHNIGTHSTQLVFAPESFNDAASYGLFWKEGASEPEIVKSNFVASKKILPLNLHATLDNKFPDGWWIEEEA